MSTKSPTTRAGCVQCGSKAVGGATVSETVPFRYEGKLYDVHVPQLTVRKCANCGACFYDNRADTQITRALRDQLNLLQPEQIQINRVQFGLTQEQLAEHIRVAPESLSRWENGHVIQSRSHDRLLQAFFTVPEFREFTARTATERSRVIVVCDAVHWHEATSFWTDITSDVQIASAQSDICSIDESSINEAATSLALAA